MKNFFEGDVGEPLAMQLLVTPAVMEDARRAIQASKKGQIAPDAEPATLFGSGGNLGSDGSQGGLDTQEVNFLNHSGW